MQTIGLMWPKKGRKYERTTQEKGRKTRGEEEKYCWSAVEVRRKGSDMQTKLDVEKRKKT